MIFSVGIEEAFLSNNVGYVLGACVIVLAGVVVYLYREMKAIQQAKDLIQDQRLAEARETQTKLIKPLEEQTKLSEKTYDLLLSIKRSE